MADLGTVSTGRLPECECCERQFLSGGKLCLKQDIVNNTPEGQKAVQKALEQSTRDQDEMSLRAEFITQETNKARLNEWHRIFYITDTWEDSPKGVGITKGEIYKRIKELEKE